MYTNKWIVTIWLVREMIAYQPLQPTKCLDNIYKIDKTSAAVFKWGWSWACQMEFPIILAASRRYLWISGASSFL